MPLYCTADCSQLSVAAFTAAPQPSPHSVNSDSSASPYASLSQTLSSSHGPANSELPIYLPPSQSPQSSPPVPHMAADGRYMYPAHYQPEVSPHAYPPTYPAPYDASQFSQNGSRPMRAGAPPSHSHVPPPGAYNPPPPGYPHYGPPAYVMPPSSAAQWTGEGWSHQYPPTYPPPDPRPQEPQYASSTGRPDAPPNPPSEHRGYPPAGPPNNSRPGERSERDAAAHPQPRKGSVPPAQAALPAIPSGLDFIKIIDSYRLIIETTHAFAHDPAQGRSPASAEGLERMLQAATYGAQALDAASKRAPPDAGRPPPADRSVESDAAPKSGPPPKKPDQPPPPSNNAADNQTCLGCNATSTPEWRRGPLGPRTLCNACGLVYAKLIKKRTREPGRSRGVSHSKDRHGFGDDAGSSGASDDDDSYGSQDRRSELGDGGGRD